MAERLPVLFIPHQLSISLVRDDVVDLCGRRDLPLLEALFAIGMTLKKAPRRSTPSRRVSTLRSRLSLAIEETAPLTPRLDVSLLACGSMLLAIPLTIGHSA